MRKYKVRVELEMSLSAADAQDAMEQAIQSWLGNPFETLHDAVEVEEDWSNPTADMKQDVEDAKQYIIGLFDSDRECIELEDWEAYEYDYGPDEYYRYEVFSYRSVYKENGKIMFGIAVRNSVDGYGYTECLGEQSDEIIIGIAESIKEHLEETIKTSKTNDKQTD